MPEHDCFENGSVGVGDGHNLILHPKARRAPVLGALFRDPMRPSTIPTLQAARLRFVGSYGCLTALGALGRNAPQTRD
jgi:hypothetical protein